MNVYKYEDYKDLLRAKLKDFGPSRGLIAKLATAAGCQRSYVSQVLHSHVHFTPDHALGVCKFFAWTEEETEFFLCLVDHARASSPALRSRLHKHLNQIRKSNSTIEKRIQAQVNSKVEPQAQYYSSWLWSAIHLAVSIPALQTPQAICKHLHLPKELVEQTLIGLELMGLVQRQGNEWIYAGGEHHLSRRSSLVPLHHSNWRARAVLSAQIAPEQNYHYTGVSSISHIDYLELSDFFLEATERARKTIAQSKEEALVCLNIDFFKV